MQRRSEKRATWQARRLRSNAVQSGLAAAVTASLIGCFTEPPSTVDGATGGETESTQGPGSGSTTPGSSDPTGQSQTSAATEPSGTTRTSSTTSGPTTTGGTTLPPTGSETGVDETSATGEVPSGASLATRSFGADSFIVWDAVAHPGGGVVVVGNVRASPLATRRAAIAHFDADGEIAWARATEWNGNTQFFGVALRGDEFLPVGLSRSGGNGSNTDQVLVGRFGLDGTYQGSVVFGAGVHEHAWQAVGTSDGGLAVVGFTVAGLGDRDALVLKLDAALALEWGAALGGPQEDVFRTVAEDTDGGLLLGGHRGNADGSTDSLFAKLDDSGAQVFGLSFGDGGTDVIRGVAPLDSDRYLLVGEVGSWGGGALDGLIGIYDVGAGAPQLSITTAGAASSDALGKLVALDDGRFVATGRSGAAGTEDVWLGRIDPSRGPEFDFNVVYDAPRHQRSFGAGALRIDGGLAVAFSDRATENDPWEPGALYVDSLGGLEDMCVNPTVMPFNSQAVPEPELNTTVMQTNVSLPSQVIGPAVAGFEVVEISIGTESDLCGR